jgi:steroid delta-isomerase-like uncharacterized protein
MQQAQLAHTFAEALNTKNLELFDTLVSEDYINHNVFVENGRRAVKEVFAGFLAAFPDLQVTTHEALATADHVIGRFTYQGTHTGEAFMGLPASGNKVEMRSIDIWHVKDGQFVEHWDELNTLEFFQQLGGFPPSKS